MELDGFAIRAEWDGLRAWIAMWGELDITTTPQLREELDGKHDAVEIVVDLSRVTFMDTQGLHAVLEAHPTYASRVRIIPSPAAARLFELAGVEDVLPIIGS